MVNQYGRLSLDSVVFIAFWMKMKFILPVVQLPVTGQNKKDYLLEILREVDGWYYYIMTAESC